MTRPLANSGERALPPPRGCPIVTEPIGPRFHSGGCASLDTMAGVARFEWLEGDTVMPESGTGSPRSHSPTDTSRGRRGSHVWPALFAVAAGALTLVAFGYFARDTLSLALDEVRRDPTQVELVPTLAGVLVVVVPLLTTVVAYFLVWQTFRLIHLARYLARMHRYTGDILSQRTPLLRLGFSGSGLPFGTDGRPRIGMEQPLSTILPGNPGTLLLGDDGSGKTTALRQCAYELSRKRYLWPIAFGNAPLPIMVPLAAYAAAPVEPGRPRMGFLAEQVAAFGPRQIAERLATALQRWHVVLLCDGLDEVPDADRRAVAAELAQLTSAAYPGVRVVLTCALNVYLEQADQLNDIAVLPRVVVTGMSARDVDAIVRRTLRRSGGSRDANAELSARLANSALGAQIAHPATMAALIALSTAGLPVPPGRGRLLHAYVDMLVQRASRQGADLEQLRMLLGHLANAMRSSGRSYVAVPDTLSAGQAQADWLAHAPTMAPTEGRTLPPLDLAPDVIDRLIVAAVAAGILEWLPARSGVRFTQAALAATCAALSLDHESAGHDPLATTLLEPGWREPLLLWAGFAAHRGELATLLLSLAEPLDDSAAPDHSPAITEEHLRLLALALATALEALAPSLVPSKTHEKDAPARIEDIQERLRNVFDRVQTSVLRADDRAHFADELSAIERESLIDLGGHLTSIATSTSMGRLVRAQAISLLGLLSSPSAIDALIAFLRESDPVLRHATDQAFAIATPTAFARLQPLLSSGDERLRSRATEALSHAGPAAIETALEALDGDDPRQRAAAARVLGALRASGVNEPLLARLDDPDGRVRVAAAEALGQIGTPDVVPRIELHLATADSELRAALVTALGGTRQARALPTLLSLLEDSDARVRAAAAEALGKLGDERAIRPLRDRLGDGDPWAQAAAATALRRLGTR